jgi:hypothetical protein
VQSDYSTIQSDQSSARGDASAIASAIDQLKKDNATVCWKRSSPSPGDGQYNQRLRQQSTGDLQRSGRLAGKALRGSTIAPVVARKTTVAGSLRLLPWCD